MLLRIIFMALILVPLSSAFASTQFRVIIDASGSMIISDPDRLTAESLRLIADLAPAEETSLGVWLFGELPRVLLPEGPITEKIKERLKNNLGGYITEDLQTDLESALTLMLDTPPPAGMGADAEQHWILVTDGMVDISLDANVNEASRNTILNPILDELIQKGIHLHTISMTGHTDKTLLKTLSDNTNASHTEVAVPDDLLSTFNRVFTSVNKPDELPFSNNTFIVDRSVEEFTLLVFHSPSEKPRIISPSNQILSLKTLDNISVSNSDRYTLVTVKLPEVGEWQVDNVDIEKSSIRIVTNLSVEASIVAPILFINEPLFSDIAVLEEGVLLKDPIVLELLQTTQNLIQYKGELKKTIDSKIIQQNAFRFKNKINKIAEEGGYELYSFVDGQTFTRKLSQFFSTIPAITLDVEDKEYGLTAFTVKPNHLRLNTFRSNVMLEINYVNGERFFEEIPLLGIGFWQKIIAPKPDDFSVRAKLSGVTQTGIKFEYWTPSWNTKDVLETDESKVLESTNSGFSAKGHSLIDNNIASNGDVFFDENPPINNAQTSLPDKKETEVNEPAQIIGSIEEPILLDEEKVNDPTGVSSIDILFYALANFAVLGVFGGFLWWYLKRKKTIKSNRRV